MHTEKKIGKFIIVVEEKQEIKNLDECRSGKCS